MTIRLSTIFLAVELITIFTSCDKRKIKHSAMNDLVVGIQVVRLYDNGEFYLELGAGGEEGDYIIVNDTIYLDYVTKPDTWPDKLVMTEDYFMTIINEEHTRNIKIKRNDK